MAVAAITTNVATAAKAEIHSAFMCRRCLKLVRAPARPRDIQGHDRRPKAYASDFYYSASIQSLPPGITWNVGYNNGYDNDGSNNNGYNNNGYSPYGPEAHKRHRH